MTTIDTSKVDNLAARKRIGDLIAEREEMPLETEDEADIEAIADEGTV